MGNNNYELFQEDDYTPEPSNPLYTSVSNNKTIHDKYTGKEQNGFKNEALETVPGSTRLDFESFSHSQGNSEGLQNYEAELRQKERELEIRRQELDAQAQRLDLERQNQAAEAERIRQMGVPHGYRPVNNFPPVLRLMYHDIDTEIPVHDRKIMKIINKEWLLLVGLLVFNAISCLMLLLSGPSNLTSTASDLILSIMYMFLIGAASFFLWYRPIYNAYMKDNALFYFIFFIFNGFHLLFCMYMVLGLPGTGSAGIINLIAVISDHKTLAVIFCGISTVLWIIQTALVFFTYTSVYRNYNNRGHTFSEAKRQAYTGFASSNIGAATGQAAVNTYLG